ncbi:Methanobactin biosynthesis cassette protein MbnH [Lishizhenia tianjinensis]|uniref:Methanobactin biosynthesis cassette protein MbnH n=1 Tax=Lishizhenia tianjinensis TaxID=477690 RepID=A0A1I6YXS4_9FLAO|nr:cytochrome c peroxidase [Lishizhenia tianjinensis]SFT55011.1 Methanobactin biosynthesis cassette protein MbnH [Lishizhenia tianjinensis]
MNLKQIVPLLLGGVFFVTSCKKGTDDIIEYNPKAYTVNFKNNTLPEFIVAADNPLTVEKVKLGRMLFYENKLSRDGSINCASCHNQANAFSDTNQFSFGVDNSVGKRQAMAIFNMAYNTNQFFWDGRADLLRDQAILPIQDHLEMDESMENVITKLKNDQQYVDQFTRAFENGEINTLNISLALENFMNSIISEDSKYDRYLAGKETLTESEMRGMELFSKEYTEFFPNESGADCMHCHSLNNFENDLYMNNGLDTDAEMTDYGRENATGDPNDRGKFKVTSLRNVAVTPPYMHDGRFNTLEEVIDHYNEGIKNSSTVDQALLGTTATGLMLDAQEKEDLINFLKTLTDYTYLNNPEYSNPH